MDEIERIEEKRFIESLISLWVQPDAPEWIIDYVRQELRKQRGLLKEQEVVEHALDVLRENGWKEEDKCEKCPLLMAVSDGVHDMAKQFRKGAKSEGR